jgi:hypothetical protein
MRNFVIIYSKGAAVRFGPSTVFERHAGRHQLEVAAADRLDAYSKAVQHFARLGLNTSMARDADGLNFLKIPDAIIEAHLETCGIKFSGKYETGILVEKIVGQL